MAGFRLYRRVLNTGCGCEIPGRQNLTARLPLDDLGRQKDLQAPLIWIGDPVDEHFHHLLAQLLGKLPYCGQGRMEPAPDRIIATNNTYIIRDLEATVAKRFVDTMSRGIISGEDRGDRLTSG